MLRACIDLGRLEMKAKDFDASKAVLSEALAEATAKAGEDSQEAGGWRGACAPGGVWVSLSLGVHGGGLRRARI
jgi:hypothetical protein